MIVAATRARPNSVADDVVTSAFRSDRAAAARRLRLLFVAGRTWRRTA